MAHHSSKTKKKNATDQHDESLKKKHSSHIRPNMSIETDESPRTSEEDDINFAWLTMNTEQILDALIQNINKFWLQMCRFSSFVMCELGGYQLFEAIALWCTRNPHLALFLLAAGIVCILPFLIIFGFGIATIVMAFTGLLMLEGTLLTVISVMFITCLGGLAIILPLVGIVTLAAYVGLAKLYSFYGDIEQNRNILTRFVHDPEKSGKGKQQENNMKIFGKSGNQ